MTVTIHSLPRRQVNWWDLCRDRHGRVWLHRRRGVRALGRGRVLRAWHRLPAF